MRTFLRQSIYHAFPFLFVFPFVNLLKSFKFDALLCCAVKIQVVHAVDCVDESSECRCQESIIA